MLFKHTWRGGEREEKHREREGEGDRKKERRRDREKRKEEGERRMLCSDEQFMLTVLLSQKGISAWDKNLCLCEIHKTYLIIQFSGFHFKQYHSVILDFFC